MAYGLTSNGFEIKDLATIKSDLETSLKTSFGTSINLQAQTPLGQIVGLITERLALLWELGEAVYQAVDPQTAEGVSLDKACALVGIARRAATYSTVTATLTGTPTTVIPAGTQFQVSGDEDAVFETDAAATIAGGGTVDAACTATTTGAISAPSGALTVIKTPVSGLTSVTNSADATLGSDEETDAELRARRNTQLQQSKKGTLEAIRTALLDVDNVEAVAGYENTGSTVDGDGRPAKSFEMVVKGGTDQDIIDAVWEAKPAGIETYGSSSGTATDSQGDSHTIYFSRPTELRMYVIVDITQESGYTVTSAQVKAAINTYEAALNMGDDVLPASEIIPAIVDEVDGIRDITIKVSKHPTTPPVSDAPIAVDADELATFADGDMTVNIT